MGCFWGEQLLPVFSQATGVHALKDSSQDLYLCGKDWSETVCKKEGGKERQEQSAVPGPGAGRESWSPAGSAGCAKAASCSVGMEGWEGRCPFQLVFWKHHCVCKAFENTYAPVALQKRWI